MTICLFVTLSVVHRHALTALYLLLDQDREDRIDCALATLVLMLMWSTCLPCKGQVFMIMVKRTAGYNTQATIESASLIRNNMTKDSQITRNE